MDAEASAVGRVYREVFALLMFISDEIEMGRLPAHNAASAVRMTAALVALMARLT